MDLYDAICWISDLFDFYQDYYNTFDKFPEEIAEVLDQQSLKPLQQRYSCFLLPGTEVSINNAIRSLSRQYTQGLSHITWEIPSSSE